MTEPSPQAPAVVQCDDASLLVFGATGLVGAHVRAQAAERGLDLVAITRGEPPAQRSPREIWLCGERFGLGGIGPWPPAPTILSLGPLTDFADWLDRARPPQARRVVALSSTSAETKRYSPDTAERLLAERLHAAEAKLFAACERAGIAWTILRPTLIWGDGRDRNLSRLAAAARRWRVLPLPAFALGYRQPIHARQVAGAVLAALDRPASAGRVLDLPGGETLSYLDMARRVAAAAAPPARVLRVPGRLVRAALATRSLLRIGEETSSVAVMRMAQDLVFDPGPAQRLLGIEPEPFAPRAEDFPAA